jgi:uncharacterized protein YndB with AHSA1/START domain
MATNETTIDTTPRRIFDVLSEPRHYADWVVGAKKIRSADPDWPAVGTKFHHTVGFGPLTLDDNTEVLEKQDDRRLVLKAKTRPLGTARVELDLLDAGAGRTRVIMREGPGDPMSRIAFNPLLDLALKGRNVEALRRLKEIAERPRD